MASLICRNALRLASKARFFTAVRPYASDMMTEDEKNMQKRFEDTSTPFYNVEGAGAYETLRNEMGDDDPFDSKIRERATGTIDDPTYVKGHNESRLVGCICEEDSLYVSWMTLYKGEPKRCGCGYWFKLRDFSAEESEVPDAYAVNK